jgi:hypothetical protein
MAYYQLHHYSAGRDFDHTDRFEAEDDASALIKAEAKLSGEEMELWCGHRRVQLFVAERAEPVS